MARRTVQRVSNSPGSMAKGFVGSITVMIPAGDDDHVVGLHFVDQSMLVVDSSGPTAGEAPLERFGFADSVKRRAKNIVDKLIDSLEQLTVILLKPQIIVPGGWRKGQIHAGRNFRFWPFPAS